MKNLIKGLLISATLGAVCVSSAFATEELSISSGTTVIGIIDNNAAGSVPGQTVAGTDLNGTTGAILFVGTINGWNISVTSAVSNSPLTNPALDLDVQANCAAASCVGASALSTLDIKATDINYTTAGSGQLVISGSNDPTVTEITRGYLNNNGNTPFGGSLIATATHTGPFSGSVSGGPLGVAPYGLTIEDVFFVTAQGNSGQITSDSKLNVTPEPAAVVSLGTLALGLAGLFRKKFAAKN